MPLCDCRGHRSPPLAPRGDAIAPPLPRLPRGRRHPPGGAGDPSTPVRPAASALVDRHAGVNLTGRQSRARAPPGSVTGVLVWMDLEMTGLDVDRHVIVEVATLITDDDLVIVAEGPDLVVAATARGARRHGRLRPGHAHQERPARPRSPPRPPPSQQAGDATLAFIRTHVPKARTVPLAGNSIGTDRRFLAAQLPEIEEYLHYRSVDVSTVKELARRWYPEAMEDAPTKAGGHRAMDDIRESVAELAYYRSDISKRRPPGSG